MNSQRSSLNSDSLWRAVITGASWSIVARMITALFGVLTTVLLARWLGAEDLGLFLTLSAWVLFLTPTAQLGLGETAVREISALLGQNRPDDILEAVNDFLSLGILGALAGGVTMLVVGVFCFVPRSIGIWAALWVAASALLGLITSFGRGFLDKWAIADSGQFISSFLFLSTMIVIFIFNFQASSSLVFAIRAGASVCGLITISFIVFRLFPNRGHQAILCLRRPESTSWRWLSKSWPILSHHVIRGVLIHTDIVLLGLFCPMQEVAIYGVASRLVSLIAFPMASLHNALAPLLSKLYAAGDQQGLQKMVRRAVLLCGIPALIGFTVLALAGPFILTHFYGEVYLRGFPLLIILSLSKLIYVFSGPAGLTLLMTGWQKTMFRITLLAALMMLGMGAWWGSLAGGIGMAWALSAAEATRFILMSVTVKQKLGIKTRLF